MVNDEPSVAALLDIIDTRDRVISTLHGELREAWTKYYSERKRCEYLEGRTEPAVSEEIAALERDVFAKKLKIDQLEWKIKTMKLVPYVLIAVAFGIGAVVGVGLVLL